MNMPGFADRVGLTRNVARFVALMVLAAGLFLFVFGGGASGWARTAFSIAAMVLAAWTLVPIAPSREPRRSDDAPAEISAAAETPRVSGPESEAEIIEKARRVLEGT